MTDVAPTEHGPVKHEKVQTEAPIADTPAAETSNAEGRRDEPRRGRRWPYVVGGVLLVLLVLVYVAPWIIAHTDGMRSWALNTVLADYPAEVHIESLELDWFSPIVVKDATFEDMKGRPMLKFNRMATDATLAQVVLGTPVERLRFEGLDLHVFTHPDGANVADVAAAYPTKQDAATSDLKLVVVDGRVTLEDERTGPLGEVDSLAGDVLLPASGEPLAVVDLSGLSTFAWNDLKPHMAEAIDGAVNFEGHSEQPISVSGSWPSSGELPGDLKIRGGLEWISADVFGLPLGKSRIEVDVRGDTLDFLPLDIPVADGRLIADPNLVFGAGGAILSTEGVSRLEGVTVTKEMSRKWIRFVAPVVAESADVEGRLSATVDTLYFPIAAEGDTQTSGTLQIDEVTASPGPLVDQLADIVRRVHRLTGAPGAELLDDENLRVELPPQNVEFRLEDRRVTHEGLQMQFAGVELRTSGAVDFDENIDMVIGIPIKPEWVRSQPYLDSLAGEVIELHVNGTLSNPIVDDEQFVQMTLDIGKRAAIKEATGAATRSLWKLFTD